MKTKRYEGKTEQEAYDKVKSDLGEEAVILSIKKHRRSLFKTSRVVVTAAFEEDRRIPAPKVDTDQDQIFEREKAETTSSLQEALENARKNFDFTSKPAAAALPDETALQIEYLQKTIRQQEEKISTTEDMLARAIKRLNSEETAAGGAGESDQYRNSMLRIFHDSLIEQGVEPEIVPKILEEADVPGNTDINLLVKIVYNTIITILGGSNPIDTQRRTADKPPQVVVFMGSTGVGKTTTIAKLSSILMISHYLRVGLITADTYRIAAVEQLRTYAEILGSELQVVYSNDEINLKTMAGNDVILVDTAGRSPHNAENLEQLAGMLAKIPQSRKFLVLSATTRMHDLLAIIKRYETITEFDLVFTKLDETESLGMILNCCYLTGHKISYVTFGQNVPGDIEILQPDKIAKALLGHAGGLWGGLR